MSDDERPFGTAGPVSCLPAPSAAPAPAALDCPSLASPPLLHQIMTSFGLMAWRCLLKTIRMIKTSGRMIQVQCGVTYRPLFPMRQQVQGSAAACEMTCLLAVQGLSASPPIPMLNLAALLSLLPCSHWHYRSGSQLGGARH